MSTYHWPCDSRNSEDPLAEEHDLDERVCRKEIGHVGDQVCLLWQSSYGLGVFQNLCRSHHCQGFLRKGNLIKEEENEKDGGKATHDWCVRRTGQKPECCRMLQKVPKIDIGSSQWGIWFSENATWYQKDHDSLILLSLILFDQHFRW